MKMDKQKFEKSFHLSPTPEKDGKISFILRKNYSDGNEFISLILHEPPKKLIELLSNPEKNNEIIEPIRDILYNVFVKIYE